jgi:periplasmic protein TonB
MNMIFEKVEIHASYKGGEKTFLKYLGSVIKYPEEAKKKYIQGEVLVGFTVGVKGEIKDVRVIRGISVECDEEALKAIRAMPDWICAIQNGRAIEEYIEMPVAFRLIDKN